MDGSALVVVKAEKDSDHVVRGSAYNLARWANMTEQEVLDALKVLATPDTRRLEPQEFDGRRIEKVEGGWKILNGHKYEELARSIAERVRKARWAREHRARESAQRTARTLKSGPEKSVADVESLDGGPIRNGEESVSF